MDHHIFVSSVCDRFVDTIESKMIFIGVCLTLRILMAVGSTYSLTTAMAAFLMYFPNHMIEANVSTSQLTHNADSRYFVLARLEKTSLKCATSRQKVLIRIVSTHYFDRNTPVKEYS